MIKKIVIFHLLIVTFVNAKDVIRTFTWRHFNGNQMSCTLHIPEYDLSSSVSEFGIDKYIKEFKFEMEYSYRTLKEKRQKEKEIEEKKEHALHQWKYRLYNKGFLVYKDTIRINHNYLHIKNTERMRKHLKILGAIAKDNEMNLRELYDLLLSFVQEINYDVVPNLRAEKYINGMYTPTEVLVHQKGDCDSKSILLSSLINSTFDTKIILLHGNGHMIIGIEGNPVNDQIYYELGNTKFILCETSSGVWLPGHIHDSIKRDIKSRKYKVVKLF